MKPRTLTVTVTADLRVIEARLAAIGTVLDLLAAHRRIAELEADVERLTKHLHATEAHLELANDTIRRQTREDC